MKLLFCYGGVWYHFIVSFTSCYWNWSDPFSVVCTVVPYMDCCSFTQPREVFSMEKTCWLLRKKASCIEPWHWRTCLVTAYLRVSCVFQWAFYGCFKIFYNQLPLWRTLNKAVVRNCYEIWRPMDFLQNETWLNPSFRLFQDLIMQGLDWYSRYSEKVMPFER